MKMTGSGLTKSTAPNRSRSNSPPVPPQTKSLVDGSFRPTQSATGPIGVNYNASRSNLYIPVSTTETTSDRLAAPDAAKITEQGQGKVSSVGVLSGVLDNRAVQAPDDSSRSRSSSLGDAIPPAVQNKPVSPSGNGAVGGALGVAPPERVAGQSLENAAGQLNSPLGSNTFAPIQTEGRIGGVNMVSGGNNGATGTQSAGGDQPPTGRASPVVPAGQPPAGAANLAVPAGQPPVGAANPAVPAGQPPAGADNPGVPAVQPQRTYLGMASDLLRPVGKFISEFAAHGSVQSVAVGLNTFIREEAAGHLLPIVEQFPISRQIAIFGVMQLGHAAMQLMRSAELNRDPEAAARALTGENAEAWTVRTGRAGQRTPEQTAQHQKSLADLAFADKSIMATQALATAANVALLAAGFVVGSSVLPVILVNEIKTVGYALARDTVQATGKLVSGHENTHGLTQGQYHQAAGAYGVAVGALGVIGAQLNRHINASTPPGETSIALLAGSAALMNTLAETFDWQNLSRHEAHNASRNAQGEDRSQVLGVANNRDDYSRLLGQTPGRVAVINCANALNLAVSMATSTLKPNEQLAVTAVLTTVIMGALHNTISPEWTAQGAVRAAVRTNNAQAAGGVAVANDGPPFVMV